MFHVCTMTNFQECTERGVTALGARLSQQWPPVLFGRTWLEIDCKGTGTSWECYTITSTQRPLTQPEAPGKHDGTRLCNTNTKSQGAGNTSLTSSFWMLWGMCLYLLFHFVILRSKSGSCGPSPGKQTLLKPLLPISCMKSHLQLWDFSCWFCVLQFNNPY